MATSASGSVKATARPVRPGRRRAISGAGLVLALAVARAEKGRLPRMIRTWQVSGALCQELARRLGSAQCRDLCGLDLTQPEGLRKLAGGLKQGRCAPVVREAARLLAEELNQINRAV
jgi:hypothetical protein